jgi:hypothetical protein
MDDESYALEGDGVSRISSLPFPEMDLDPNASVKLTCSAALLNISLKNDAENIFLEHVRMPGAGLTPGLCL